MVPVSPLRGGVAPLTGRGHTGLERAIMVPVSPLRGGVAPLTGRCYTGLEQVNYGACLSAQRGCGAPERPVLHRP
jgi:hypothetical protein